MVATFVVSGELATCDASDSAGTGVFDPKGEGTDGAKSAGWMPKRRPHALMCCNRSLTAPQPVAALRHLSQIGQRYRSPRMSEQCAVADGGNDGDELSASVVLTVPSSCALCFALAASAENRLRARM